MFVRVASLWQATHVARDRGIARTLLYWLRIRDSVGGKVGGGGGIDTTRLTERADSKLEGSIGSSSPIGFRPVPPARKSFRSSVNFKRLSNLFVTAINCSDSTNGDGIIFPSRV